MIRSQRLGLNNRIKGRKAQRRPNRPHRLLEALESVAAKGNLLRHCRQCKEGRVGREPAPGGGLQGENDGYAADCDHGKHAHHSQRPAQGQTHSRFAWPALPQRQSLRAYRVHLAVQPGAHPRIAQQQEEDQHGLLRQGTPCVRGQAKRAAMSQRPGKKEVEDSGKESSIGAQAAASLRCAHAHPPTLARPLH